MKMKKPHKVDVVNAKTDGHPEIEKAMNIMLEGFEVNNIKTSHAMSAMLTIMANVYLRDYSKKDWLSLLKSMENIYEDHEKVCES